MTPERIQHLDVQYILTLENSGALNRRASPFAEAGRFDRYRDCVADAIGDIRRHLKEPILAPHEYAYIYLAMWSREEVRGAMPDHVLSGYEDIHRRLLEKNIDPYVLFPNLEQPVQPTTTQPETLESTPIMSAKITFKTVTFINNEDVTRMTEEQLIGAVKTIENEIADLQAVKTESTKIAAKIVEAQATLANVVAVLDAR